MAPKAQKSPRCNRAVQALASCVMYPIACDVETSGSHVALGLAPLALQSVLYAHSRELCDELAQYLR